MNVVARLVLAFLWALSWLPLALQAAIGRGLGTLLWVLAGSRKRIALRNLELTMPEKTPAERRAIAYGNFQWIARSFLERGLLWYAPPARMRRLIHVEGDPGQYLWGYNRYKSPRSAETADATPRTEGAE